MSPSQSPLTDYFEGYKTDKKKPTHKILYGDVFACLDSLEDNSIHCAITSPPYWGQRDYGFDNQIGNEPTQEDFIRRLVMIFTKLLDKMHPQGIFFLNIGDKYINKYGNTPLGMIPYKLAYWMTKHGWNLEDIIVWFKPNHMPSSVKNRFTNTYEPVFVLSKLKDNYYKKFQKSKSYSNILKIPLQQLPYKHMASYPEKLVKNLISLLALPMTSTVLDPFAGSGTTTKAIQDLNQEKKKEYNSIMIEVFDEFVKIILKRCNLNKRAISRIKYVEYDYKNIKLDYAIKKSNLNYNEIEYDIKSDQLYVKLIENEPDYLQVISHFINDDVFDNIDDDGIVFLGFPKQDIEKIFELSQISKWIIRNMIVVSYPNSKNWFPLFLLVKDIKTIRYKFNIDTIRIDHSYEQEQKWNEIDFIGFKVVRAGTFFKSPKDGLIAKILKEREDGLPEWVIVKWEDDTYSIEEIINPPIEDRIMEFSCAKCSTELEKYYHTRKEIECPNCSLMLWKDLESIPKLRLNKSKIFNIDLHHLNIDVHEKNTKRDYDGKFKDAKRVNMGQSPGARASVFEMYFSVQRYYKVKQGVICDYLNLRRDKKKLSKKGLTEKFPPEYIHTVGHWLRKDMGGSLPKVEDMDKLNLLLELSDNYVNLNNRMGLKLQTVTVNVKGKNPGDYLEKSKQDLIQMLKRLDET